MALEINSIFDLLSVLILIIREQRFTVSKTTKVVKESERVLQSLIEHERV